MTLVNSPVYIHRIFECGVNFKFYGKGIFPVQNHEDRVVRSFNMFHSFLWWLQSETTQLIVCFIHFLLSDFVFCDNFSISFIENVFFIFIWRLEAVFVVWAASLWIVWQVVSGLISPWRLFFLVSFAGGGWRWFRHISSGHAVSLMPF